MLRINILKYAAILLFAVFAGCKKQTVVNEEFATLQLYGWTTDPSKVVLSLSEAPLLKYFDALPVTSYQIFNSTVYIRENKQPFSFFAFPDTFPSSKPVLKLYLELEKRKVYSLFVGGELPSLDTTLIKENFPAISKADGKTGFRFLNLMQGDPVSVRINGDVVEASLPYMGVSEFKLYPITEESEPFNIEIIDIATEEVLVSHVYADMNDPESFYSNWLGRLKTFATFGIRGERISPVNRMRLDSYNHDH